MRWRVGISYLAYVDNGKVWVSRIVLGGEEEGEVGRVSVDGDPLEIGRTESVWHDVFVAQWASEVRYPTLFERSRLIFVES